MLPREAVSRQHAQTVPVGKGVIDREMHVVELNETLAAYDGIARCDAIGRPLDRVTPTLAPMLAPLLQQVFTQGTPLVNIEIRTDALAHTRRWWVSCFPIQAASGTVLAVDVVLQEDAGVTNAFSVADGASAGSNDALQLVVELVDWQSWEQTQSVQDGTKGFVTLEPGVLSGSFAAFVALIYPDDRARVKQAVVDMHRGADRYAVEFRMIRPNGVVRWFAANGYWMQPATAQPRLLSVVADITERKHAETVLDAVRASDAAVRLLGHQAQARSRHLYELALLFSNALTVEQIATVLIQHAIAVLGVLSGSVGLLANDANVLEIVCAGDDIRVGDTHHRIFVSSPTPFSEAVRTDTPNWVHSKRELLARYPALPAAVEQRYKGASIHVPLRVDGTVIGGLALRFATPRIFSDDDRAFVLALAEQCAQAMDRARLYEREDAVRTTVNASQVRLTMLERASAAFAGSLDYAATMRAMADVLVPDMADYCLVHVLEHGVYTQVAAAHVNAQKKPLLNAVSRILRRQDPSLGRLFNGVLRSGEPFLAREAWETLLAFTSDDSEKRGIYQALAPTSFMLVPLVARNQTLGLVTLGMADSERRYDERDLALAKDIADRCALAVDNAQLYAAEHTARTRAERHAKRLEQLQKVTALLSQARTPADVGEVIAEHGTQALGARAGAVSILKDQDDALESIGVIGYDTAELSPWKHMPLELSAPITDAVRTGAPILLRSRAEWCSAYPHLADTIAQTNDASWASIPLLIKERSIGGIALSFSHEQAFTQEDSDWMAALAQQCAQALDRARLYAAETTAREHAEQAVRVRDEVIALVSHDLKNPLTALRGRVHYAQRWLKAKPPGLEQIDNALRIIGLLSERMTMQIDDVLDLARLRAGASLELQRRWLDLVALVRELVSESQQSEETHTIAFITAAPSLMGSFDGLRLERALRNLLDNAIKYSPLESTVTVQIATEVVAKGTWAVINVRDQGIGIPAADLPHVFERFHRAENVSGRIAGTGLGLASARQIIEQHGGTITVSSTVGEGTTFTLRLPLAKEKRKRGTREPG